MHRLLQFTRTTLIGGILFLGPLIVMVVILEKALGIAHKLSDPLAAHLPTVAHAPVLLACAALALFCFIAGLFALTAPARKIVDWLESTILSKIPGYVFLKGAGESALGFESGAQYPLVLARIEDAWQFGFLVERLEGGHLAVFVPGAPSPMSGAVYFMSAERVRATDISMHSALKCLKRLGVGSGALLRGPDLAE